MVGRYTVLAAATVASLSCGLNYCFSAYAPQLGTRLHLTSTQLNTVGAAGNLGVYLSSPVIGRIVDKRGPKPTLVFAAIALTSGYLIIRAFYTTAQEADNLARRTDPGGWFAVAGVPGLVAAQLLTGMGSTAGLSSVGNSVAKSFRKRRAAALSVVLSGFGLSAFFYSTVSSLFLHPATTTAAHPSGQPHTRSINQFTTLSSTWLTGSGDDNDEDTTSAFLLLLALGSLFSMLVGLIFVEPVPPLSTATSTLSKEEEQSQRPILSSGAAAVDDEEDEEEEGGGGGSESGLTIRVVDSRADHREGAENPRRAMTPGASSSVRPEEEEEEEEEEATPTSRALSHRRCEDENGPTERTPLLLGPPAPPAGHTSSDSTTAAAAVTDRNNITGWALLRELDFYLIFLFNGLCAGVGLCYINNLGTIVRSLSYPLQAESTLTPAQIARHQARLVSLLSIFNFLGRLVSGFGSDYLLHRRRKGGSQAIKKTDSGTGETRSSSTTTRGVPTTVARGSIPRVVFLPLTSLLFLLSQLSLLSISHDPAYLFLPTALTGLAHGCLFGLSGIIGLERFGIKSFSQTNGVLALAPALFGQTTNLLFGRIYDSHLSSSSSPSPPPPSFLDLEHFAAPPSICTLGQACYVRATYLTCGMSLAATVVGIGLALGRKEMRISRVP